MLGRKSYTTQEIAEAKKTIDLQLSAYKKVIKGVDDEKIVALFEPRFFNGLALTLDRFFVHRLRQVTGKDGNPVNELEMIADSLLNNGGKFRTGNVIKYAADDSVLKLKPGETIEIGQTEFERLYKAFMTDLEAKFAS